MTKSGGVLMVVLGTLTACGGEAQHPSDPPSGGASNAGAEAMPTAGSAGKGSPNGGAGSALGGAAGSAASGAPSGGAPSGGAGSAGKGGGAGSGNGGTGGVAGSAGLGQAGSGVVTTPEALMPTVTAFCAAARACCANSPDPVMLTDCESGYGSKSQTVKSLMSGAVTIDAAGLAKCLAAYQAAATSCEENSVLDACNGIVQGTRAEGQSCASGAECAGAQASACLITETNGTTGVCKKVPRGKAGDACSVTCRPNDSCVFTVYGAADSPLTPCFESDGLYCAQSATAQCQAILATNANCESDEQCGSQGYCDSGGSHTCQKRSQLNESCGMCIPSLSCIDGKCKSPPFSVGSTCQGYSLGPY